MPKPTPPTPLSDPPPHWLIEDYQSADMDGQMVVIIVSDVALHLSLEYTPQEPTQSYRLRWRRGMGWVRDKHWLFTAFGLIEQSEAGDTTTHTFYINAHQSSDRLWLRFAHDYAAQYVCPVCGQTTLPHLERWVVQQSRSFFETRFYCSVCNLTFPLTGIKNQSQSKSTTPFFPALPAYCPYKILHFESWYQIINLEELFFEEFSS